MKLTADQLNEIARRAVDCKMGTRAPQSMNAEQRDEWQADADRAFFLACGAINDDMSPDVAHAAAYAAI